MSRPSSSIPATLVLILVVATSSYALDTGIPDPDQCYATTRAAESASVLTAPAGTGTPLSACYGFDAGATVDATIDFWVVDTMGDPIVNFPFEDMWLETASGNMAMCPGGTIADQNTDVAGHTTFSHPLYAGACGSGIQVFINGIAIGQLPLDINVNSPDMDDDLSVNLTDVVYFAEMFFTEEYCADFYWDGIVNLSDVVVLAPHIGESCP